MADMRDPSTLTDEELDEILAGEKPEEPVEEPEPSEAESEEQEAAEEEAESPESEEEEPEKPEEEEPEKLISPREQRRVSQLLEKLKEQKQTTAPEQPSVDYSKIIDADEETIKRLNEEANRAAAAAYDRGTQQIRTSEFLTGLKIDGPRAEAKYPQLDKYSPEFKENVANDVNSMYLQLAGWDEKTRTVRNPDINYYDFVDSFMGLANDVAQRQVQEEVKVIKKQAAKTGIRPDGSGAKKLNLNKAPENMTDEELDAYLQTQFPQR